MIYLMKKLRLELRRLKQGSLKLSVIINDKNTDRSLTSQVCPVVVKLNFAGVCWFVCSICAQWMVCIKYGPIDWTATNATHIMFVWRNNTANNPRRYYILLIRDRIGKKLNPNFKSIKTLSYIAYLITYQWSLQTNLFDLSVDNTSEGTWM